MILPGAAAGQGTNLADIDTSAEIFPQPVTGEDLSIANVTSFTALLTQPASGYPTSLPTMDASPAILSQPALGQDVQLSMLYDSRTTQFFGGVSLWDNEIVNTRQTLEEHTLQNGEFTYSTSLDEARNQAALDVEGALGLDLSMFKAAGSARYLDNNKTSTFEAHVDVSCTIFRRTRRIPQEVLASMQHERKLDDPQFTHFVGEVVEGGSAILSFVQSCSSAENAKKILGRLKAKVMLLSAAGEVNVDHSEDNDSSFEGIKISYSSAMAENVTNIEDAHRVAHQMPTKLMKQLNTLTYKHFAAQNSRQYRQSQHTPARRHSREPNGGCAKNWRYEEISIERSCRASCVSEVVPSDQTANPQHTNRLCCWRDPVYTNRTAPLAGTV